MLSAARLTLARTCPELTARWLCAMDGAQVKEGVHTLEVDAPGWYFEQVKLDVHYKGNILKVRATSNGESGGSKVHFPFCALMETSVHASMHVVPQI